MILLKVITIITIILILSTIAITKTKQIMKNSRIIIAKAITNKFVDLLNLYFVNYVSAVAEKT